MTTLTDMNFLELGFNKNEAKTYLSLIKFKEAPASLIIKDTKFHKNIVYDNLEKLVNKGLVSYIQKDSKKHYKIENSQNLVEIFKQKKKDIETKEKLAQTVAKEIEKLKTNTVEIQDAKIYRGKAAVKTFYTMTLSKRDFVVFGAHQDSLKIMGENFWKIYNKKRFHAKIHAKIIFNQSLKEFSKKINDKYTEIKFFERENEPLTETHVQGDFVAIIVWSEEPLIFYIEDRKVAKSYKMLFKKLWKQALE